jgi:hypothetical protein
VEAVGTNHTLFDDLMVSEIMRVTGADELSARFMLALHYGIVSGDVEIEGQTFVGTPLRDEPALVEATQIAFQSSSLWSWGIVTGRRSRGGTVAVSFSRDYERSLA